MISRDEFLSVYVPKARSGKSALEIADALGIEETDEKRRKQFVSQKVSNYRRELQAAALEVATSQGLDEEATTKLVEEYADKLPRLRRGRNRASTELVSFLDDLLAQADAEPETEDTPE